MGILAYMTRLLVRRLMEDERARTLRTPGLAINTCRALRYCEGADDRARSLDIL